jgi:hypothetical protein
MTVLNGTLVLHLSSDSLGALLGAELGCSCSNNSSQPSSG